MGQKVNPISFRLPITRKWASAWYVDPKNYAKAIYSDAKIREAILEYYGKNVIISKIEIKRMDSDNTLNNIRSIIVNEKMNYGKSDLYKFGSLQIAIHTASSGAILGKNAKSMDGLKSILKNVSFASDIKIDIEDIKRPDIDAACVAHNIALQLAKRASFKRVAKRMIDAASRFDNCLGVKIICSGRLGGAEIAKSEVFKHGSVPLHTMNANVEYGFAESLTIYGIIGVKVYIYLAR